MLFQNMTLNFVPYIALLVVKGMDITEFKLTYSTNFHAIELN